MGLKPGIVWIVRIKKDRRELVLSVIARSSEEAVEHVLACHPDAAVESVVHG
jgi:hypothetical protein